MRTSLFRMYQIEVVINNKKEIFSFHNRRHGPEIIEEKEK